MTNRRTWLGLLALVLFAALLWWQQGDGVLTSEEPTTGTTPTVTEPPTGSPTGPAEESPTGGELQLPSPSDTGAASMPPLDGPIDPTSGLRVIAEAHLPPEAVDTLRLIDGGGPFPYDQDDSIFQNREGILPDQPEGYYREYTVVTPGVDGRGARRIVTGARGEFYWTDDHYRSFSRIARSGG